MICFTDRRPYYAEKYWAGKPLSDRRGAEIDGSRITDSVHLREECGNVVGSSPAILSVAGRKWGHMSCSERVEHEQERECDLASVVQTLVEQAGNSAQVLECYYWTQEPGLLELIRAFLAMPVEARTTLRAFFAAAVVRNSITASVDSAGTLTLRSPEAAAVLSSLFGHGRYELTRYLV